MINIGVDFHDTITYSPEFFLELFLTWPGKKYIVTGTPDSRRDETISQLKKIGFSEEVYDGLLMGYEYEKSEMTIDHFHRMKKHKLQLIQENNISIYFDDNPFYVEYLRTYGITVFQTILDEKYLTEFENKNNFFTCNLQRGQFNYLGKGVEKYEKINKDDINVSYIMQKKL